MIRKLQFQRLAREVIDGLKPGLHYKLAALLALQYASEAYLGHIPEDALLLARHAKRVTISKRDMRLALCIYGELS